MYRHYQAVLAGVGTEQIDVAFPDFPGCVTVAATLEASGQARFAAKSSIRRYCARLWVVTG